MAEQDLTPAQAETARETTEEVEREYREARFRQMREDLTQAKLLMSQFSRQLDEWLQQAS